MTPEARPGSGASHASPRSHPEDEADTDTDAESRAKSSRSRSSQLEKLGVLQRCCGVFTGRVRQSKLPPIAQVEARVGRAGARRGGGVRRVGS